MIPPDVQRRLDGILKRHDSALDRFPRRDAPEFWSELRAVVVDYEALIQDTAEAPLLPVERARLERWLAGAWSDLARPAPVAEGEDLANLTQALLHYEESARILDRGNVVDPIERAKLDFNCANALRRFDGEDVVLLREAERRYVRAQAAFAPSEPALAQRVTEALTSVRVLLRIAPLAKAVRDNQRRLSAIDELIANDAAPSVVKRAFQAFLSEGRPAGLVKEVLEFVSELPSSILEKDADGKLRMLLSHAMLLGGGTEVSHEERSGEILEALQARLSREVAAGKVSGARLDRLNDALRATSARLGKKDEDLGSLARGLHQIRDAAAALLPLLKNQSYGLPIPKDGRAANVRAYFWEVRRRALETMVAGGLTEGERTFLYESGLRATEADRRVLENADDVAALDAVEEESTRPEALRVRRFFGRDRPYLAHPLWSSPPAAVDPNTLVFSGTPELRRAVDGVAKARGLTLLGPPTGHDLANERWQQLSSAAIVIGDLSSNREVDRAEVAYEIGIAQSLGKPVVLIADEATALPFDIDVPPLSVAQASVFESLAETIDRALYTVPHEAKTTSLEATLEELGRIGGEEARHLLVDVRASSKDPIDPIALQACVESTRLYLGEEAPHLIFSAWPGQYSDPSHRRLFHVMPFRHGWSNPVSELTEASCAASHTAYVRDDRVLDASIIPSIWEQIGRATHVLVDLTGFNQNVAFELGLAHTIKGHQTLIVTQDERWDELFPSIRKMRVHRYHLTEAGPGLRKLVESWLADDR